MSSPKKGRKVRPASGKSFPNSHAKMIAAGNYDFAEVISGTLCQAFGGSHASVKTVMAFTGARERTVKNWFGGKNAPSSANLVKLARHLDEILEVILLMAGRTKILSAKKLVDARGEVAKMLGLIDQLQETEPM